MSKKKSKSKNNPTSPVIDNRKARHNYEVIEQMEAGIVLLGSEVKSLRQGKANLTDCYAEIRGNEIFLKNSYIAEYDRAGHAFNHASRRDRKLLLHKGEIKRLTGKVQQKGLTLIPLRLYFNAKGVAKIMLALCGGKSKYDKRETEKNRDWQRQKERLMKGG